MNNKNILIYLFKIIPKSLASRLLGYIARLHLPKSILDYTISWYCKKYSVNKDEISYPEGGFISFDQFFTRNLKKGIHKFDNSKNSIISPVDARISQLGKIDHNSIIQAKGIKYSISDLIQSDTGREFIDGSYITLYLSPTDYHRIHSPVGGNITGHLYIPGKLYTVQEFMVNGLKGLFTKNERLISYITNEHGLISVCMIGAMNVGRISLSYSDIITNKLIRRRKEYFYSPGEQPQITKGEELGIFHIGSTVIILFQKDTVKFENIKIGNTVRVGEKIASFH